MDTEAERATRPWAGPTRRPALCGTTDQISARRWLHCSRKQLPHLTVRPRRYISNPAPTATEADPSSIVTAEYSREWVSPRSKIGSCCSAHPSSKKIEEQVESSILGRSIWKGSRHLVSGPAFWSTRAFRSCRTLTSGPSACWRMPLYSTSTLCVRRWRPTWSWRIPRPTIFSGTGCTLFSSTFPLSRRSEKGSRSSATASFVSCSSTPWCCRPTKAPTSGRG